jgi:transposase-like protein
MTTASNSMTVGELVGKILGEGNGDFLKEALGALVDQIMAVEVEQLVGAGKHERSGGRVNLRNGTRGRRWDTRVGSIDLSIPKLRRGSYFPSFLEPRRRAEQAFVNVIQEAYVHGVSTRKVEDLVQAMGVENLSKSEVSRVCAALDEQVEDFRNRPLVQGFPYLWLDATHLKVREGGRVTSNAIVVAYGLNEDGYREIVGVQAGSSESGAFWHEFLQGLVERGLKGVQLVISDAHVGLQKAIASVLSGSAWQRCTVHFMRNVQARVPKSAQAMVTAAVRTIFVQPDRAAADAQLARVAETLEARHPEVSRMLWDAKEDILAHFVFPQSHWSKIRSTNLLERLNREIGRRADVVGIFPNRAALLRLVGMVLNEQHDEWQAERRYLNLEALERPKLDLMGDGLKLPDKKGGLPKAARVA